MKQTPGKKKHAKIYRNDLDYMVAECPNISPVFLHLKLFSQKLIVYSEHTKAQLMMYKQGGDGCVVMITFL